MDTETKIYFHEKQRFTNPLIYISVVIVLLAPLLDYISEGHLPRFRNGFLVAMILSVLIIAVSFLVQLETRIDETGVYYRFFPFGKKFNSFTLENIEEIKLRKYKPLREYGGWGLRHSFKNGKAVNVKGKDGIQLVLKDAKKILIGTQMPKEAEEAIHLLLSKKSI